MPDNSDPSREAIHEAIAAHPPLSGILTGWVLLTEWMDTDGHRWLGMARCSSTTPWTAAGMLHEGLKDDWPPSDEDDD